MALMAKNGDIPKNAIALSRQEALDYQWKQIQSWPKKSDTWPYRWGISLLGAFAGASGWYINSRYRRKLKLRNHGYIMTSLPLLVSPATFAIISHLQFVTNDLFLDQSKCPVCLQQKASIVQVLSAIAYPAIMSPAINLLFAMYHTTYRVPYWKDWKGTLSLWWKFTKPMGKSFLFIACAQVVAANVMTYIEAEKLYNMRMKLMKSRGLTEIKNPPKETVEQ